jgi:hypothetical protein
MKGMVMGDDWHWEACEGMVRSMVGVVGMSRTKNQKMGVEGNNKR